MQDTAFAAENNPIDVVITWVDGNDPKFLEKFNPYLQGLPRSSIPGAHHTRFASVNEIKYCVLSILKFAPFIRNIYIVTDNQYPQIEEEINTHFSHKANSIKIVDHKEIFVDFEKHLPTFNSRSIECMLWRIEGLSDNFIYFNDDVFLIRETSPQDWFTQGHPVLRGRWLLRPRFRYLWITLKKWVNRYLLGNPNYQPRPSYHTGQWLAAKVLGFKWRYFFFSHTPFAINRKRVETFFTNNIQLLEENISLKFKHEKQFNFVSLCNHLEILAGNQNFAKPNLAYLQPNKRSSDYLDRKLRICEQNRHVKFICIQSLEMCPEPEREKLFDWMDKLLEIT